MAKKDPVQADQTEDPTNVGQAGEGAAPNALVPEEQAGSTQVDQTDPVTDASAPQDAPEAPEPQEAPGAPADEETPAEDAAEPAEESQEPDTPVEEPVTPPQPPEQPAPTEAANDPTPREEAERQVSEGRGQIDGSGILQHTNQEVIDNFPKNENGQVVIDSNGQIVGLDEASQPAPPSGSSA